MAFMVRTESRKYDAAFSHLLLLLVLHQSATRLLAFIMNRRRQDGFIALNPMRHTGAGNVLGVVLVIIVIIGIAVLQAPSATSHLSWFAVFRQWRLLFHSRRKADGGGGPCVGGGLTALRFATTTR